MFVFSSPVHAPNKGYETKDDAGHETKHETRYETDNETKGCARDHETRHETGRGFMIQNHES